MSTTRTLIRTMRRRFFLALGASFAVPTVLSAESKVRFSSSRGIEPEQMVASETYITGDCFNLPGKELSFHPQDGERMMADPRCFLILHHDYVAHANGWTTVPIARQSLPVFGSASQRVNTLSIEQVGRILSGRITSWKQVGGDDANIRVVLRMSRDKRENANAEGRFRQMVRRGGLNVDVGKLEFERVKEYEVLSEMTRRDPNILAFGLRGVPFDGLKLIAVDGRLPIHPETYPFTTTIVATARVSSRGEMLFQEYLEAAVPRFAADAEYMTELVDAGWA